MHFKTPKGTELPLLDLKGKQYLQVAFRIVWFREEKPDWGIETEILSHDKERSLVRAIIRNETGRIIAQASKQEDQFGFKDGHLEKAETGAIGRALALIGFGTQFASEFDEQERLADSPIGRPGATPKAAPSPSPITPGDYIVKVGQYSGKRIAEIDGLQGWVGFHSANKKLSGPMLEAVQMAQKYLTDKGMESGRAPS